MSREEAYWGAVLCIYSLSLIKLLASFYYGWRAKQIELKPIKYYAGKDMLLLNGFLNRSKKHSVLLRRTFSYILKAFSAFWFIFGLWFFSTQY